MLALSSKFGHEYSSSHGQNRPSQRDCPCLIIWQGSSSSSIPDVVHRCGLSHCKQSRINKLECEVLEKGLFPPPPPFVSFPLFSPWMYKYTLCDCPDLTSVSKYFHSGSAPCGRFLSVGCKYFLARAFPLREAHRRGQCRGLLSFGSVSSRSRRSSRFVIMHIVVARAKR